MNEPRFIPGRMIAGRFRVIERVGSGGMGEVYRAEDLKLGQPVALKFLLPELSAEPGRLEAFFAEVRLARQVSHPNVCRVHDIEEMEGTHYLSMEFVDGEDLASLLRRIGRLPVDKAVQIAREICAGLAAIHARGVLHRDLKPGNVMIDGRGHARITDFGLALPQDAAADPETISGTPAYLAPECLFDGRPHSVRSDLYGLGLVLYELFTGHRPFDATTPKEMLRLRYEGVAPPLSRLQPDIGPEIERVILRCLERDPERRPHSALAAAAPLPGGDPLAAAIAAGETPSPEMVAATTTDGEGLRPAVAWGCVAALMLGLALLVAVTPHTRLLPALPLSEPPEAMAGRARALLHELGVGEAATDRAYGYQLEEATIDNILARDRSSSRWGRLARPRPPVATFWYRQSPVDLMPTDRWDRVTYADPPGQLEGMVGVRLDALGRLRRLDAAPTATMSLAPPVPLDSAGLFRAAGLEAAGFRAVAPGLPAAAGDQRLAWEGSYPELPGHPVRVEAVAFRGHPVFFEVEEPWMQPLGARAAPPDPSGRVTAMLIRSVRPALLLIALLLGAWLARRNLRAGRGDTRRALRVASALMALRVLYWALGGHHTTGSITQESMAAIAWGLYDFAYGWIFYVAVEPYARRLWPRMLTTWVRLLDGNATDARVGRDILIGCLMGTAIALLVAAHQVAPVLLGGPPGRPDNVGYIEHQLNTLLGARSQVAELLWLYRSSISLVMGFVVILVMARLLVRNAAAALVVSFLIFMPLALPRGEYLALNVASAALSTLLALVVMLRFSLLAAGVGLLIHSTLQSAALGTPMNSWSGRSASIALLLVLSVGLYGFLHSLGRRPAIRDVLAPS